MLWRELLRADCWACSAGMAEEFCERFCSRRVRSWTEIASRRASFSGFGGMGGAGRGVEFSSGSMSSRDIRSGMFGLGGWRVCCKKPAFVSNCCGAVCVL